MSRHETALEMLYKRCIKYKADLENARTRRDLHLENAQKVQDEMGIHEGCIAEIEISIDVLEQERQHNPMNHPDMGPPNPPNPPDNQPFG